MGATFDAAVFNVLTSGFTQCGGAYDRIRTATRFYIHCYQTIVGRYVVVYIDRINSQLTVCEIEIYQQQGQITLLIIHVSFKVIYYFRSCLPEAHLNIGMGAKYSCWMLLLVCSRHLRFLYNP